jgi:hemerythrin superfamily protein
MATRSTEASALREAERLSPVDSTTGTGDVLEQLERDHRRVEGLFARSALCDGRDRLDVMAEIVDALTLHAELEETVVYPAIEKTLNAGGVLIDRSRDEHDEMKTLLDRLAAADRDDDAFLTDLRELQLAVQAHVAVEEAEIFPAFRTTASPDVVRDLTDRARKAVRQGSRPTPDGS